MDYKIELQNNNADLETIINRLNTLPDVDTPSGGVISGGSMFATSASGRVPECEHGYATIELNNIFETSAIGAVE